MLPFRDTIRERDVRPALTTILFALAAATTAPARADEDEMAGQWRIEQIRDAAAVDAAATSFEFLPNGRVAATIGCNRLIGQPEFRGGRIVFGAMAATRMACPPPLDALERQFSAALDAARRYRRDGARLVLSDDKGQPVVTLRRAD
jgi:heat shock protein HslJ